MLSDEPNRTLTRVGPGTPMGDLLRHYWMPVAGVSELAQPGTKPIRLLGEDLILFRDGQGEFGLIDRRCPHRGADLAFGMVERSGLRCAAITAGNSTHRAGAWPGPARMSACRQGPPVAGGSP